MVTCKSDTVAVPKMNSVRARKTSSSNSSGFRLLEGEHLETSSSISRNSIYKLKIDLMFDDTRSIRSNRLDDPRGSHRTRSIIMYGRSELASTVGESSQRSITSILQESSENAKILAEATKKDVRRISNSVQAQIEQLFTDVAKDATSSFAVTCLGSLPLKDKVTSLQGLQEPLRELYLNEITNEKRNSGFLDICATGLRVKINSNSTANKSNTNNKNNKSNSGSSNSNTNNNDGNITPFHNIAVWSAVKFVVSEDDGGAAFLPLITDPENIDKTTLFQPLSPIELKRVTTSTHAPIFAVVMRSAGVPKLLECHGFICKSTEDAIVIAATLYQSLMAHVSTNSHRSTKRRTPRQQNGVSCISIASSSAQTGSNYLSHSQIVASSGGRKSSFRSSAGSRRSSAGGVIAQSPNNRMPTATRSVRKKRVSNSSLSSCSNVIKEAEETTTEERKRRSHKTKRAPPVPAGIGGPSALAEISSRKYDVQHSSTIGGGAAYASESASGGHSSGRSASQRSGYSSHMKKKADLHVDAAAVYRASELVGGGAAAAVVAAAAAASGGIRNETNGDILTRVAIPRSGSFLNTGGLTRYKSRAARRHSGKLGGGGGGGSPLGFSELFNEFRLHENLHSLDDILYAIIDADGMSFNDLKPIYKEFLLKLAVTLTKDELYQRSKNIMRRQRKKNMKQKTGSTGSQKKQRTLFFNTKSLKKVFQLGQFRSCRGKPPKPPRNKELDRERKLNTQLVIGPPSSTHHQQRSRMATSGSDESVARHENGFNGLNRNSSSGYCSLAECDSEACIDRCYCSLRKEQQNNKLRRKNELNAGMGKKVAASSSAKHHNPQMSHTPRSNRSSSQHNNRHSLVSCKSDDKCYCSLDKDEPPRHAIPDELDGDESLNAPSDTTWCDTDSCISTSKCYCKRDRQQLVVHERRSVSSNERRKSRSSARKSGAADKLALDYELFTINGNGKSVQPHEALSVKKSVEAAAIFADVKLSQTTDIKSLCPITPQLKHGAERRRSLATDDNASSRSSSRRQYNSYSKRSESRSIDRKNERNFIATLSSNSSQKSYSADDLLSKLSAIEEAVGRATSTGKYGSGKFAEIHQFSLKENFPHSNSSFSNYQSMKAVSASLEDTLGYLP